MTTQGTHIKSEAQMIEFAQKFAKTLKGGEFITLNGELGAGKSVFARSFIRGLVGNPDLFVPSPTFTILQTYDSPIGEILHFDLYRIKNPDDVWELNWEDATSNDTISIIEWPSKAHKYMPEDKIEIEIKSGDEECSRLISMIRMAG